MSTSNPEAINFSHLTVEQRIRLAQEIWDSIAKEGAVINLNDAQKKELDRRLEEHRKNPDEGSNWEDVEKRIRERLSE
ncbi:MAG: addiction module protein [Planctomycetaceae bacterium]